MLIQGATLAASERADLAREMLGAVTQIRRDLQRLPHTVRRVRAAVPPPQDPVSLDHLLRSRGRALPWARAAATELARAAEQAAAPTAALASMHGLIEEIRFGMMGRAIVDDLSEMLAEAGARTPQRALRALENRLRRAGAEADRLFLLAVAAQDDQPAPILSGPQPAQDPPRGATPMDGRPPPHPADESPIRELSEIVATLVARPAALADGSSQSVSGRRDATLEEIGVPVDARAVDDPAGRDAALAQLIDGLQRNFSSRVQDGNRVYFRSTPELPAPQVEPGGALLQGRARVQANLVGAYLGNIYLMLDRMRPAFRFVPVQSDWSERIGRIRLLGDQIVATASDPLGINAQRGTFQMRRLGAAILDLLRSGEVIRSHPAERASDGAEQVRLFWRDLASIEGGSSDDLRRELGVVGSEEVGAELTTLGELITDIWTVVASRGKVAFGVAAARLEAVLTDARRSVADMQAALAVGGTTLAEAQIEMLPSDAGISLAQLLGWIEEACKPFSGAGNAAGVMTQDEFLILAEELGQINDLLAAAAAGSPPLAMAPVRQRLAELKRHLLVARDLATSLSK